MSRKYSVHSLPHDPLVLADLDKPRHEPRPSTLEEKQAAFEAREAMRLEEQRRQQRAAADEARTKVAALDVRAVEERNAAAQQHRPFGIGAFYD